MPDEKLNEENNLEKIGVKQTNENNIKKGNIQDGIKIVSRKPKRAPRY